MNRVFRAAVGLVGAGIGGYGAWAAVAYARYGRVPTRAPSERDDLLDRFILRYDVYERHTILVNAPPDVTLAAARNQDILTSPLISAIFKTRAWVLGSSPETATRPQGLLGATLSMGWRVLEERPGQEIVVGAATRPWQGNVTFRGISPDAFAAFQEPDYVKIVWTLRVDPLDDGGRCQFITETRAVATDTEAAQKFRRYWALASPGISLIRRLGLPSLKASAERSAATAAPSSPLSAPLEPRVR